MYSSTPALKKPAVLPRLPVPNLRATLDRYLKSIQPLLLEDERRQDVPFISSYATREKWADEFEFGIGKKCQERLLELDKKSPHNWLDDNFWLDVAYLQWRAPLLINSNWWLAFHNDNQVPMHVLEGKSNSSISGITPWQVRRASWLIHRLLEFKSRLETQDVHPDTTRTGVWFQENAAKTFNTGRVPKPHRDTLSSAPSPTQVSARKLLIMVHDWYYTIIVYDEHGAILPASEIERKIRSVVQDVHRRKSTGETTAPIGILSADNRDDWAQNLNHLLALSPDNEYIHKTILESVFCLSLDHYTYSSGSGVAIDSPAEIDHHLHNIRSGQLGHNRFFDKTFTLIVESNSRAGAMGEHSPVDALVPSIVAEYAVVQGVETDAYGGDPLEFERYEETISKEPWERLDWIVDEQIKKECVKAEDKAIALIDNSHDSVFWFNDYGTDKIKGFARLSPDAYIQMALQLAWYRLRGEFTATYETALTRMFQHGRTETIRTLSVDSRAFVLAMMDPATSTATRSHLLRRAIQTHSSLTREAATGRGIDRHLLALRLLRRSEDGETCALLDDPLFERSQTWKLSTSGLSAGQHFRGTGFGAGYEDGYGINYLAAPEMIKFGIESKHSSPLTSTTNFKEHLQSALREMMDICVIEEAPAGLHARL